jgi:hypothetical protein
MYEIGLAHATRLPEEVLIFRSDNDPLLFDVANIRVNHYDPDGDPAGAAQAIADALADALHEVEGKQRQSVDRALASLDVPCILLLIEATVTSAVPHPRVNKLRDAIAQSQRLHAIHRLLELELLETVPLELTKENILRVLRREVQDLASYTRTPFGKAVVRALALKLAGGDIAAGRELLELLERAARDLRQG